MKCLTSDIFKILVCVQKKRVYNLHRMQCCEYQPVGYNEPPPTENKDVAKTGNLIPYNQLQRPNVSDLQTL